MKKKISHQLKIALLKADVEDLCNEIFRLWKWIILLLVLHLLLSVTLTLHLLREHFVQQKTWIRTETIADSIANPAMTFIIITTDK